MCVGGGGGGVERNTIDRVKIKREKGKGVHN